jgi:hypothetical protein
MIRFIRYLRARLCERSTLGDIAAGIAAAAFLPWPWSLFCLAVSLAKALVADGLVAPAAQPGQGAAR